MDPFSFAPIAALLGVAYATVQSLAALFTPIAGTAAAAIATVTLTMLVRSALIPVGVSQVKAEWTRRRLAPKLQELQRRYKKNPQLLQQKTLELYQGENASMFAGILPALVQAPVLSLVYALFLRTTVDGHANALLTEHLLGTPLGVSFMHLIASGALWWPDLATFGALLAVMAGTAWVSRQIARHLVMPGATPAAGATRLLSWLPFASVIFAAFVPLAATLYLATTTLWTLVERVLLRRRYWHL
ncbi:MAG: membrane protein insertase YidC [Terrimesophilobacter sp.]